MQYYHGGVEMIRRDLLVGHWKPYLERALKISPCYEGGINGGEVFLSSSYCPDWNFFNAPKVQREGRRLELFFAPKP